MTDPPEPRRRRRRQAPVRREGRSGAGRVDYRRLVNPFEPLRVLADEAVADIHEAALRLLSQGGVRVLLAEARRRFRDAGASVDEETQMVLLDPDLVGSAIASAPAEFTITPRSAERTVTVGGRSVVMVGVGGPPHTMDLDRGRRTGNLEDFEHFVRLTQHYDVIHTNNPAVEPQDIPVPVRHLEVTKAQLLLTDKVPFVFARGRGQVTDCMEMARIAHGMTWDEFTAAPHVHTVINTNSPRQIDVPMCLGLIQFAELNQVCVVTPFTLSGAMAPVTLAGALTLQHAEAMAAITLTQLVRPGAPVVYGAFTSNVDMRSGAPAFGTPEAVKAALASGQLARFLGLPWRSSGVNTSNAPDAQAGYETMTNMMGAVLGGANVVIHAAGWLESGLSASLEKMVLDVEMLQIIAEVFQPVAAGEEDIALEAILGVPPGGHFFGADHTMARYDTAFYEPIVFSRQNFGQWTEAGSLDAAQRANAVWKRVVADFEAPPIDTALRDELEEFVARRAAEGGAPPES